MRHNAPLTFSAAARELAISRTTLYKLINAGALKLVYLGHIRRVPRDEIDRLTRANISVRGCSSVSTTP